ncbi:hypothetical protein OPT61_g9028 [Boeremia exigua]|uniref:Uncharacterized protein n=1 Tax=Boeremia exigua TaxID=749465 RepID=A0ACC2HW64_9PLEO|nr:hypothetical protein OPT61_g9028 [Boeremia exigua]
MVANALGSFSSIKKLWQRLKATLMTGGDGDSTKEAGVDTSNGLSTSRVDTLTRDLSALCLAELFYLGYMLHICKSHDFVDRGASEPSYSNVILAVLGLGQIWVRPCMPSLTPPPNALPLPPNALPPPPNCLTSPPDSDGPPYVDFDEVKHCEDAAAIGDLDGVKKYAQQVLGNAAIPHIRLNGPLSRAAESDQAHIVRYFLHLRFSQLMLPVETAVRSQAIQTLEVLLEYGWDINAPLSPWEPPPFWIPIATSNRKLIDWFLRHGANPNARCDSDYTPMSEAMLSAHIGELELVKLLLEAGADPRKLDTQNKRPIFWAKMYGYEEVALVLAQKERELS